MDQSKSPGYYIGDFRGVPICEDPSLQVGEMILVKDRDEVRRVIEAFRFIYFNSRGEQMGDQIPVPSKVQPLRVEIDRSAMIANRLEELYQTIEARFGDLVSPTANAAIIGVDKEQTFEASKLVSDLRKSNDRIQNVLRNFEFFLKNVEV